MKTIKTFINQNPNFNLTTDNLARTSVQKKLNWGKLDKAKLLPQLQTYQRLHRIHADDQVVEQLMKAGFHSAHQIALTPLAKFTVKVNGSLGEDPKLSSSIWHKSRKVSYQVNQMMMGIRPEPRGTVIAKKQTTSAKKEASPMARIAETPTTPTDFETDMPAYDELFGPQYYCQCDECRSIWGPAAYFVDLMSLIDQYITQSTGGLTLLSRRPDLGTMELSCANTYNEEPYLRIANQVMEAKLKTDLGVNDLGTYVAENVYPFNLPLNLPEEEISGYLNHFGIALSRVFDYLEVDATNVARAALGISTNQLDLLTRVDPTTGVALGGLTNDELSLNYGLYPSSEKGTDLATTLTFISKSENFQNKTGLSVADLSDLFYQNCPVPEVAIEMDETGGSDHQIVFSIDPDDASAQLFHQFFINQKETGAGIDWFLNILNAVYDVDDASSNSANIVIVNKTTDAGQPSADTFDLLQRFIRLAQKMQWTFADLDWALKALGATEIDADAIQGLAKIQAIMDQLSIPVDQATALFADMKTYGRGNGVISKTLFDRTFNQPDYFNGADEAYHPSYTGNPLFTQSLINWNFSSGFSAASTADSKIKSSLLATLNITEAELAIQLDFLKNNIWDASVTTLDLSVENLSLLYRFSQLPQLLDIPFDQFFNLLPCLPDLSADFISDIDDLSTLLAAIKEAKASLLSFGELNYLLHPEVELPLSLQQQMARQQQLMLTQLQASANTALLNAKSFVSPYLNDNYAQQLLTALVENEYLNEAGVVLDIRPIETTGITELLNTIWSDEKNLLLAQEQVLEAAHSTIITNMGIDTTTMNSNVVNKLAEEITFILKSYKEQQDKLLVTSFASLFDVSTAEVGVGMRLTKGQLASYPTFDDSQDYAASIPYSASINPSEFTAMFWVNPEESLLDSNQNFTLYSNRSANMGCSISIYKEKSDDHIGIELETGSATGTTNDFIVFPPNILPNQWIHIAITISEPDNDGVISFQCFLNGIAYTSTYNKQNAAMHFVVNDSLNTSLGLGSKAPHVDTRLYDYAMSAQEIQRAMNQLKPLSEEHLCAWWPMRTGQKGIVYDWSGNGHDGVITGDLSCLHYNPRLLLTKLEKNDPNNQALFDYLKLLPRNLSWLQWNQLSPAEGLAIAKNPIPFGTNSMRYGYYPDFKDLMSISAYKKQCAIFEVEGIEYFAYLNQEADANDTTTADQQVFTAPDVSSVDLISTLLENDQTSEGKRRTLAKISNWDSDQLDFLISSFNTTADAPDFNTIEGVQTLVNCFQVSQVMGVDISVIWHLYSISDLSVQNSDTWDSYVDVATEFRNAFVLHYQGDDLATAVAPMKGQMEEGKRDFLCNLLIWELGASFNEIKTQDQLYEFLLLDVEMTSVVNISPLKLGLNSLQLYIQRCLMNLEANIVCTIPKSWWSWMGDYREWQANREVYVYPENYVDPTLRKLQTPLFSDLVDDIKQSAISRDSIKTAYTNYLDGLKEIANLHVVDSYVYEVSDISETGTKKILTLFGRTISDPATYYYREGVLPTGADAVDVPEESIFWTPWVEIGLNIPSDYITPVFAFNKLFVFWVTQTQASSNYDGVVYPYVTATINFAYQEAGGSWSVPQVLQSDILICTMDQYGNPQQYQGQDPNDSNYYNFEQWQKVQAWPVSPDTDEEASILITLGDIVTDYTYTSGTYNLKEYADFNTRLCQVNNNSAAIGDKYTSIITGFLLNAGLRVTEIDPAFDIANTSCNDGQVFLKGDSTQLRIVSKPDFIQPNIITDTTSDLSISLENSTSNIFWDTQDSIGAINNHGNVALSQVTINGKYEEALYFNNSNYLEISSPSSGVTVLPQTFIFSCNFYLSNMDEYTFFSTNNDNGYGLKFYIHSSGNLKIRTFKDNNHTSDEALGGVNIDHGKWYYLSVKVERTKATFTVKTLESSSVNVSNKVMDFDNDYPYVPESTGAFALGLNMEDNNKYGFYGYMQNPVFKQDFGNGMVPFIALQSPDLQDQSSNITFSNNGNVLNSQETINSVSETVLYFNGTNAALRNTSPVNGTTILPQIFSFSCSFKTNAYGSGKTQKIFDTYNSSGKGVKLYLYEADLNIKIYGSENTDGEAYTLSPSGGLSINTWYDLFITVEQTKVTCSLRTTETDDLISTAQVTEFGDSATFDPDDSGHFYFGVQNGGSENHFSGYVLNPLFSSGLSLGNIPADTTLAITKNQRSCFICNINQESYLAMPKVDIPTTDTVLTTTYLSSGMLNLAYSAAISNESLSPEYQYVRLYTGSVNKMLEEVFDGGLQKFLMPASQYIPEPSLDQYEPTGIAPLDVYMNFSGSYGTYFWELFYHIPMYLARSLQLDQQFAEAMQWYDVIFDPMLSQEDLSKIAGIPGRPTAPPNAPMREYLLFAPFQSSDFESMYEVLTNDSTESNIYKFDPFDPNAIAAFRPTAYEKATVMQYIGNLIAYGDYLFTEDSWESINSATMYYTTAEKLLGKAPQEMPDEVSRMDKNYNELSDSETIDVPAFLVDVEVEVSDITAINTGYTELNELIAQRLSVMSNYFCVPYNTQLETYWETVEDRLSKIRNGLNINGQVNDIPLFQPPIDPAAAVQAAASGSGSVSNLSATVNVPYYRFSYLIGMAKNLTSQVIQFGGSLLSALEKQDVQHLSNLRETQSNAILNLTTQIKQDQINQLYTQQANLQASLTNAQIQQETYQSWIDNGRIEEEKRQIRLARRAILFGQLGSDTVLVSSPLFLIPTMYGVADGQLSPGDVLNAIGESLLARAAIENKYADVAQMNGAFERSNDNWNLQLQLATNSITALTAQLQGIQYQIDSAIQDYNINQTHISQSNDVINFLQTKFTNEELYQWMVGQVSTIYFQAYQLAFNLASMAQTAYQYEFSTSQNYISNAGWNDLYKGLMAGETLSQSLQQLEQAYILGNSRSLEIEKTISLLQLQPEQLSSLKDTGSCTITLSEQLFDLDFPGHYKRKIASIAITIPAIIGPYQNVHATLTQLTNMILAEASTDAVQYAMGGQNGQPPSGVYLNSNSNQAIALSSGNNDSGLFQLNFNDQRYLPFEGTGAVSTWQLDMPTAANQINFNSISDVIIHLRYTAYDGGADFRNDVINLSYPSQKTGKSIYPLKDYSGTKYISLRQFNGVAWRKLLASGTASLDLHRSMFIQNLNDLALVSFMVTPVMRKDCKSKPEIASSIASTNKNIKEGIVSINIKTDSNQVVDPKEWEDVLIQIVYSGTLIWE